MTERLLTADATATGGRAGRAATGDGRLNVQIAMPGAPGQTATSVTPEQLFATGYAACYGGAYELAAKQNGTPLTAPATVTAKVTLCKTDPAPRFGLEVELVVDAQGVSQEQGEAIAEKAHLICPYSNAIRGNVAVSTSVRASAAAA